MVSSGSRLSPALASHPREPGCKHCVPLWGVYCVHGGHASSPLATEMAARAADVRRAGRGLLLAMVAPSIRIARWIAQACLRVAYQGQLIFVISQSIGKGCLAGQNPSTAS
jgi:hypothetical protein